MQCIKSTKISKHQKRRAFYTFMASHWSLTLVLLSVPINGIANDINLSFKNLNTLTIESVYVDQEKTSELIWQTNNAELLNISFALELDTKAKFIFDAASNTSPLASQMNNYDWLDRNSSTFTHHSIHNNTKANTITLLDVRLLYNFHDNLSVTVGYSEDYFAWQATGGQYIYYGVSGELPNTPTISYSQHILTPYVGISTQFAYGSYMFAVSANYSEWGRAIGRDTHHLRARLFKDIFPSTIMAEYMIGAGYKINNNFEVWSSLISAEYNSINGHSFTTDLHSGETNPSSSTPALSNQQHAFSVGLTYVF